MRTNGMTVVRLLCGGTLALGATTVFAAETLDYTFLNLDFITRDVDAFDDQADTIEDFDDGTGLALNGSFAVTERFFIFGSYSETESDVTYQSDDVFLIPEDTEIKRIDAGVGTSLEINNRTDFVGRLAYTDIDFGEFELGASNDFDVDDLVDDQSDGYFVDAGVRSQLLENLEGSIGVRYLDIEDTANTSLIGSLLFELSPAWDINLSVDAGDEIATYALGLRFSPGRD